MSENNEVQAQLIDVALEGMLVEMARRESGKTYEYVRMKLLENLQTLADALKAGGIIKSVMNGSEWKPLNSELTEWSVVRDGDIWKHHAPNLADMLTDFIIPESEWHYLAEWDLVEWLIKKN